jgi:hypothetical protein
VTRSAGLPESVGGAPVGIRVFLAFIAAAIAIICALAGRILAARAGWLFALLVEPIAIATGIAAVFIAAPYSRFGIWLDHALPLLKRPAVALIAVTLVAVASLAIAFAPAAAR